MKVIKSNYYIVLLLTVLGFCKPHQEELTPTGSSELRKDILTNIGNNLILPGYSALNSSVFSLDSAVKSFTTSPDASKLQIVQNLFKVSYERWEYCSSYNFGPAMQSNLGVNVNTFPCDTSKINTNSKDPHKINFGAISNLDAKGFPAVDYLLSGTGTGNDQVLNYYTSTDSVNKRLLLTLVVQDLKISINNVASSWNSGGGNYINTFTNTNGTDIGSSMGQLINALVYDLDVLKNAKVGIPSGRYSMGALLPQKSEAYYSDISLDLLKNQVKSMENIYLGNGTQGDKSGLDDYLVSINAKYNGGSLNDTIKNQFKIAQSRINSIPDPFSAAVQNNTTAVNEAYIQLQKLLVLMKTDMPSAMGVLITFEDNDGD